MLVEEMTQRHEQFLRMPDTAGGSLSIRKRYLKIGKSQYEVAFFL